MQMMIDIFDDKTQQTEELTIEIMDAKTQEVIFAGNEEQVREYIMFTLFEEKLGYCPQMEIFLDPEEIESLDVFIHSCTWEDDDIEYTEEQLETLGSLFDGNEHEQIKAYLGISYRIKVDGVIFNL
ncbi:hypothetical protein [Niallia taxi]|uniref:hypothetical protein n=1 Tax=Niallia taxi TaxID=2499688 RepID=UPI0015F3B802|nr:hypothetical protein [Niallia taxi]